MRRGHSNVTRTILETVNWSSFSGLLAQHNYTNIFTVAPPNHITSYAVAKIVSTFVPDEASLLSTCTERISIYILMNKHAFSCSFPSWVKVGGPLRPAGSWGRRSFSPAQKTRREGKIVLPLSGCRSLTRLIPLLCSATVLSHSPDSTLARTDFSSSRDAVPHQDLSAKIKNRFYRLSEPMFSSWL